MVTKVENEFFTAPSAVTVASGLRFADAMRGESSLDGPLLLTDAAGLAAPASTLASVRTSLSTATVLGTRLASAS